MTSGGFGLEKEVWEERGMGRGFGVGGGGFMGEGHTVDAVVLTFEGFAVANDVMRLDGDRVIGPIDNFEVVCVVWVEGIMPFARQAPRVWMSRLVLKMWWG